MSNAQIIAEKVMGWELTEFGNWKTDPQNKHSEIVGAVHFDPEHNDTDLMMVWDKFIERVLELPTKAMIYKMHSIVGVERINLYNILTKAGQDRRTAMVECMVKAVIQSEVSDET